MAASKFATMIHKNTNKITFLIIYAVLEWTLILFLLINSLFCYLIIKFSQLFALKPPCFWCSTLHRFFEPENVNLHRDLLCEFHSKEVSVLGFCQNHKKLAEVKDFCEDCFSCHLDFQSEVKLKQSDGEDKCSCCGLKFHKHNVSSRKTCLDDEIGSGLTGESPKIRIKCFESETCLNQFDERGGSTSDFLPQHLEFFFDSSGNQLVPIELVDSTDEESQTVSEADQDHEFGDYQMAQVVQEHHTPGFDSMEPEETNNSLVFHAKISEFEEKSAIVEELQETHLVHEEPEVSVETEIPIMEACVKEPSTNSHDSYLKVENDLDTSNMREIPIEDEEAKIPNTPSSVKKTFMFDQKESREEESLSLDGSLMSEMVGENPVNTTEKLKSALKILKAELEEERNASAIAASETMAMITRLQEEKAAMQMEAVQYQRMMEEQAEYDQEALQLLNELMIKKEKELEMYKRKVADYEARFSQDSLKNGTCSNSVCSTHSEAGNEMEISGVPELESSLVDFEEERLSIFEQIKALEEKLFTLSDEEDQHFADVRPVEDVLEGNGFHYSDMVTELNGFHSNELENGKRRMDIEDEIDQVYERLHALEADREFLKHCIGSMNKGENGMKLLQEILQHLRDLRTMDFQA